MNVEKLNKLTSQVRIGGKGTARRKKKVVHRNATTDDKKLQSSLKKLNVNSIPGIEEVNMIKDDGSVIQFTNPKVQAALAANTYAVTGHGENKSLSDIVPNLLNLTGAENFAKLKTKADATIEEVPEVESFEQAEATEDKPAVTENKAEAETV